MERPRPIARVKEYFKVHVSLLRQVRVEVSKFGLDKERLKGRNVLLVNGSEDMEGRLSKIGAITTSVPDLLEPPGAEMDFVLVNGPDMLRPGDSAEAILAYQNMMRNGTNTLAEGGLLAFNTFMEGRKLYADRRKKSVEDQKASLEIDDVNSRENYLNRYAVDPQSAGLTSLLHQLYDIKPTAVFYLPQSTIPRLVARLRREGTTLYEPIVMPLVVHIGKPQPKEDMASRLDAQRRRADDRRTYRPHQ